MGGVKKKAQSGKRAVGRGARSGKPKVKPGLKRAAKRVAGAKRAKAAKPAKSAKRGKTAKPAKTAKRGKTPKPAKTAKRGKTAKPVKSARPAKKATARARGTKSTKDTKRIPTVVRIRDLDPYRKCGPGTSVERLIRVDAVVGDTQEAHLVYLDRHGWYCEHGRNCPAVGHARKHALHATDARR